MLLEGSIREYGYKETLRKFDAIRSKIPKVEGASLESLFRLGEFVARETVPVRTGFLQSTIGWIITSQNSGEFFATADYAQKINGGTSKMQARPFFDLAVMEMQRAAPFVLNEEMQDVFIRIQDPHILNLRASQAYERFHRATSRAHAALQRRHSPYLRGISAGGSATTRYLRPQGLGGTAGVRRGATRSGKPIRGQGVVRTRGQRGTGGRRV